MSVAVLDGIRVPSHTTAYAAASVAELPIMALCGKLGQITGSVYNSPVILQLGREGCKFQLYD